MTSSDWCVCAATNYRGLRSLQNHLVKFRISLDSAFRKNLNRRAAREFEDSTSWELPTRVSDPHRCDETSSAVESRHPRASRAERRNPLRPSAVPDLMGCSGCAAAGSSDTSSGLSAPGLQSQYAVRFVPSALRRIGDASFHDQLYGPRATLPRAA